MLRGAYPLYGTNSSSSRFDTEMPGSDKEMAIEEVSTIPWGLGIKLFKNESGGPPMVELTECF